MEGNCSECHREKMKRSPVLNSNPEMNAHIVERQEIHHLTLDLNTTGVSELLSSCLLKYKTPNYLQSLCQHSIPVFKMHASV